MVGEGSFRGTIDDNWPCTVLRRQDRRRNTGELEAERGLAV
jgi:hypothetical protein